MADQPNGGEANSSPTEAWSDEDYLAGLKRLQAIQDKIEELRGAIPNIIAPMTIPPASNPLSTVTPSALYAHFALQAINTTKDIKVLRETWENDETRKIFQYAEDSLDKDADIDWEFVSQGRWGSISEDTNAGKDDQIKPEDGTDQANGDKANTHKID